MISAESVRHPVIDGEIDALQAKLQTWSDLGELIARKTSH